MSQKYVLFTGRVMALTVLAMQFQQLMNATLRTHLTLDFVLRLPAGKEAFLRHLKVHTYRLFGSFSLKSAVAMSLGRGWCIAFDRASQTSGVDQQIRSIPMSRFLLNRDQREIPKCSHARSGFLAFLLLRNSIKVVPLQLTSDACNVQRWVSKRYFVEQGGNNFCVFALEQQLCFEGISTGSRGAAPGNISYRRTRPLSSQKTNNVSRKKKNLPFEGVGDFG